MILKLLFDRAPGACEAAMAIEPATLLETLTGGGPVCLGPAAAALQHCLGCDSTANGQQMCLAGVNVVIDQHGHMAIATMLAQ
jgi:hypothetical protein